MNLSTCYLGLPLRTPLVASASPLTSDVSSIRRLEDAGAAAVVCHSLFEEQIRMERREAHYFQGVGTESFPEALSFFPDPGEFRAGVEAYVELIAQAKAAVRIPVIGSLNGSTPGGWLDCAKQIEQAGADALELNIYSIPTDPHRTGAQVEQECLDILRTVRDSVKIPIAVKLSPFFSSMANMAMRLCENGANGLVLFNRFYQPDIELETLEVTPNVLLSTPMAMRLPLRWIAILHGRIAVDFAATGGIHRGTDALKLLMAGADVTMLCSVLLRRGVARLTAIEREMCEWLVEHEYESVEQLKGSVSQQHCPEPAAFERAQYMRAVTSPASAFPVT